MPRSVVSLYGDEPFDLGAEHGACVVTTRVLLLAPCLLLMASPAVAQVPLDTVTVVARPLPATQPQVPFLVDAGFYHRQRLGFGYFLTRAEIDKRDARVFGELLMGIPGIRVHCNSPLNCHVAMPGSNTMFIGKACSPSVVVDGLLLSAGG